MIVVKKSIWRWLVFSVFLTACAVVTCAGLYFKLNQSVRDNQALIQANAHVIKVNQALISALQVADEEKAHSDAKERAKLRALRQSFQAFQGQVRQLGGSPPPLPPELRSTPDASDSSTSSSSRPPSPSAAPQPRSSTTPAPRPTPRSSPSSSPTPCAAHVGTFCLVP